MRASISVNDDAPEANLQKTEKVCETRRSVNTCNRKNLRINLILVSLSLLKKLRKNCSLATNCDVWKINVLHVFFMLYQFQCFYILKTDLKLTLIIYLNIFKCSFARTKTGKPRREEMEKRKHSKWSESRGKRWEQMRCHGVTGWMRKPPGTEQKKKFIHFFMSPGRK